MASSSNGVGGSPRPTALWGLAVLVALTLAAAACGGSGGSPPLSTGKAPWPNPDRVGDRIAAAGLDSAPTESLVVHYHSHLDVFVDGKAEPVAPSIGREDSSLFSPLHTHTTSGMIHIEAPTDQRITLGMLFTEWGVRLTGRCVGGYCGPATPIAVYVDGARRSGSPSTLVLRKGEEIALLIGTPPATIPSGWDCLAGIDPRRENPAQCQDFGQ